MSENPGATGGRWILLAIAAVSVLPFVAAYLLNQYWRPAASTNYGDLLAPAALSDVELRTREGSNFRFADLRGNWVFVMVDDAACNASCLAKLYLMRQVRLTQGKDRETIQRVWLLTGAGTPAADVVEQYEGTRIVPASADLLKRFPAAGAARDHIYLADPFGNLVMRFPPNADPNRVKKDLSRLVRASSGWVQQPAGNQPAR